MTAPLYQLLPAIAVWYAAVGGVRATNDEYMSCGRDGRTYRFIPDIPCDLKKDTWCASAGSQYPWSPIKRFVYENQGLMKRMYGDQRHINVMRSELFAEHSNMVSPESFVPPPRHRNSVRSKSRPATENSKKYDLNRDFRNSRDYRFRKKQRPNSRSLKISIGEAQPKQQKTDSKTKSKYRPNLTHASHATSSSPVSLPSITATETSESPDISSQENKNTTDQSIIMNSSEIITDKTQVKTTKSFAGEFTTTTNDNYETEGGIPALDAFEWAESNDKGDVSSYAYIPSELLSSLPPERENNRVLTPESFSTYSTFSTDSAMEEPVEQNEELYFVDESFTEGFFTSTLDDGLTTMQLEERVEPVIHGDLLASDVLTEEIKQKIAQALGDNVKIQVNTGNLRGDFISGDIAADYNEEGNTEQQTIKTTTNQVPLSERSSLVENDSSTKETVNNDVGFTDVADDVGRRPVTPEETIIITNKNEVNRNKQENQKPVMQSTQDQKKPPPTEYYQSYSNIARPTSHQTVESKITPNQQHGHYQTNTPQSDDPGPKLKQHQNIHQHSPTEFQPPTMEPPKPAPNQYPRGENACPIKEEWVAPYWANNTKGQVRALLNIYPFEQYVHYERCVNEHRQMYCRRGCRCEQQYRLHRLLALDPLNECRGIFSDWFRFPSCCVCKCYDIPQDLFTRRKARQRYIEDEDYDYEDDYEDDDFYDEPDDGYDDEFIASPEEVDDLQALESKEQMDVNGWGAGHYRPHTPKANIRPQISPRRYPRPMSHIAPPSSRLLPPPPRYDSVSSKSSYSSISDNTRSRYGMARRADTPVTLGTLNAYTRPYFDKSVARVLGSSLSRAPRNVNMTDSFN